MNKTIQLLRKREVLNRVGFGKSSLYTRIKEGVFPQPISLGERAVAWPEHEVNQVLASVIAGASTIELKDLVQKLTNQRKALPEFMQRA